MKRALVMVTGIDYFARMMAEGLRAQGIDAEFHPMRIGTAGLRAFLACDCVYFVGGIVRPRHLVRLMALLKPIVFHWVGTDVLKAVQLVRRHGLGRLYPFATHWAEIDWIAAELLEAGIAAEVVPLVPIKVPAALVDLPAQFRILTYLPQHRSAFYGQEMIQRIAKAFPQVTISVAASDGSDWIERPANVEFLGWVADMEPVYARSSLLIRLPEHDGLSFMVTEAMARGRHVLWTYQIPGVQQTCTYEEVAAQVQRMLDLHKSGRLSPNWEGAEYVRTKLSAGEVLGNISARLRCICDRRGSERTSRHHGPANTRR